MAFDESLYVTAKFTTPRGLSLSKQSNALTIKDTSKSLTYTAGFFTDNLANTPMSSVNEGGTAYIVLTTTGVPDFTYLDWEITGAGITLDDTGASTVSGQAMIRTNKYWATIKPKLDLLTEGNETLIITFKRDGVVVASASIVINDTSALPIYNRGFTYGGSQNIGGAYTASNKVSTFNTAGDYVSTNSSLGIAGRLNVQGAGAGGCAIFYGGTDANSSTTLNTAISINQDGTLAQGDTNLGTSRQNAAGANMLYEAMFFGGSTDTISSGRSNRLTRINKNATLVTAETTIGSDVVYNNCGGGFQDLGVALYVLGHYNTVYSNKYTRINSSGTFLSSDQSAASGRTSPAGALLGDRLLAYGGQTGTAPQYDHVNKLSMFNSNASLVSSEATLGTSRFGAAGVACKDVAAFVCGYSTNGRTNIHTKINSTGTLVSDGALSSMSNTYKIAGAGI